MRNKFIVVFLLIVFFVQNYNNFNELKQDMQNKVQVLAKLMKNIYEDRCDKKQITCPVQSYNLCEGTNTRQCLNKFPRQTGCSGSGFFSTTSAIRIPNSHTSLRLSNDLKYFICQTAKSQFEQVLKEQAIDDEGVHGWAYFGSHTGAIRVSPAFKYEKQTNTESCKNYDCRLRYWYTESVYRKKKIIILVQNSRRVHEQPSRFQSIKLSIQALLKTLQKGDYINIIEFSNTAVSLFGESELKLFKLRNLIIQYQQQKLDKNLVYKSDFYQAVTKNMTLSNITQTNYKNAFKMAMLMIKNSRNQNPEYQNIILFFSAFKPSGYSENTFMEIEQYLRQKEKQLKLNLIFFGFGVNMIQPQGKQLMRKLTCSFSGVFIQIQDVIYESMFVDQAQSYYDYLIQGNQINYTKWTQFYQDAWGLGTITTVAKGAYYSEKGITKLIGIAGIDVQVEKLIIYKKKSLIKKLLQVTEIPFRKNINECALETIRKNYRCSNKCHQYKLCTPRVIVSDLSIIISPKDNSTSHCCPINLQQGNSELILGLIVGFISLLLVILLLFYFFIYRRKDYSALEKTYADIFRKFKNFDQTRIRSDSQISNIKQ